MLFNGRAPTPGVQVTVLGTARGRESVVRNQRHRALIPATPTADPATEARVPPPTRNHPASPP